MLNILFCSAGRRGKLIEGFKESLKDNGKIVAVDYSLTAPAIYFADKYYTVPAIDSPNYISRIMQICKAEEINAITTLIDPEIEILAQNRELFKSIGVEVLTPSLETAEICFDKYVFYKFLKMNNVPTVLTYGDIESFDKGYSEQEIDFPVFVKPRGGSGSVGAEIINDYASLSNAMLLNPELIIQKYMDGFEDIDVDVYVDTISHKPVSIFSKRKLETRIGGASKTISFIDEKLPSLINRITEKLKFYGPIDIDLWFKDGAYFVSEINPRFGGAYIHAFACGLDFSKLIENNIQGKENDGVFNNYEEGVYMLMYDDAVFVRSD